MGEIMKSKHQLFSNLCVLLIMGFLPNLGFTANLNPTHKTLDSVLSDPVLGLDSANALGQNPFVKQDHGFLLKIGNSQTAFFPEILNSKNPIVLKTLNDIVKQSLVSDEVYHAELKGRYLIYRGSHNSILYRYDADKQSLREFVYLANKTELKKNHPVIEWKFAGANLKEQKDGSVVLSKTRDVKNEVRKISNDSMANRIQRFLNKENSATTKNTLIQTLFIIPKPEFIDGNQEHHTQGLQYSVHKDQLALNLEPNEQLSFPLWVDPTLLFSANDKDALIEGSHMVDLFGFSVNRAGDVNNDGIDDVIVGTQHSSAFIFFGGKDFTFPLIAESDADVILNGEETSRAFGRKVIPVGDVNSDNIDDVMVTDSNEVYLFFGRNSWPSVMASTEADVVFATNDSVFLAAESAGDVNNDNIKDILLGNPNSGNNGENSGSAYIFFGRNSWASSLELNTDADVIINGVNPATVFRDRLGTNLTSVGDVNGDNIDDFFITSRVSNNLFFGRNTWTSPLTRDNDADVIFSGAGTGSNIRFNFAGDLNGDNLDDITWEAGNSAFIFFGRSIWPSTLNPNTNSDVVIESSDDEVFGGGIASADLNQDGLSDLIVGGRKESDFDSLPFSDAAFIFYGRESWPPILNADGNTDVIIEKFTVFNPAGDVNNDGHDDLIFGDYEIVEPTGNAFLFFSPFDLANSSGIIISDAQDAYLRESSPNSNFGSEPVLIADGTQQDPNNGSFGEVISVISWDTSSIPTDAVVDSVRISLNLSNTSNGIYNIFAAQTAWSENTVDWNDFSNLSNIGSEILETIPPNTPSKNEIDLNQVGVDLVQGWIDGSIPNNGIVIKTSGTNDGIIIDSSEATDHQPTIKVLYHTNKTVPRVSFVNDKDSYLRESSPTTNYGSEVILVMDGADLDPDNGIFGEVISVMAWDLSSIPADATLGFAKFTFSITDGSPDEYHIYEAKQSWEENAVVWNDFSDPSSIGATILGTIFPDAETVFFNQAGLDLIQGWIDGSVPNNGVVIKSGGGTNGLDFVSKEIRPNSNPRPQLTLAYTIDNSPPPGDTTVDLVNAEDSYVRETSPTVNYGSETVLLADGSDEDPDNSNFGELLSVISWDVSGIPNTSVVQNAQVTLDLFNPSSGEYKLYAVNAPWAEGTVSWNDVGLDIGSTVLGTIAAGSLGSTVINLNASGLALVQGWIDGTIPNNGLAVRTGGATNGIDFNSSEAGSGQPKLTITYSDSGPPPPTPVEVSIGNAEDSYLRETSGNTNYGSETLLQGDGVDQDPDNGNYGELRPVLSWDVSSIPTDAVVDSASITLNLTDSSTGSYELFAVNTAWTEGTVAWNDLDGPGDIGSTIIGTITSGIIGNTVINLNASGIALVQGWIDGSISNDGIVIISGGTNNGIDLSSSEAASGQPILNVTYTQP